MGTEPPVPCSDRDGDGHQDRACGGDDCDDTDPAIHPGAEDVCLDGDDRDCDGIVDGPMLMGERVQLSDHPFEFWSANAGNPVWTGSEYLVVWVHRLWVDEDYEGFLGRIDPTGDVEVVGIPISPSYTRVNIAWTGSSIGATWRVGDDTESSIHFRHVDLEGRPLSDSVTVVDTGWHADPLVVWTGESFALFWTGRFTTAEEENEIYHARLGPDGSRLVDEFRITDCSSSVDVRCFDLRSVAWTGSSTGIVWAKSVGSGLGPEIHFMNLPADAVSSTGEDVRVSHVDGISREPAIAWSGEEFAIAWIEDPPDGSETPYFTLVSPEGVGLVAETPAWEPRGILPRLAWTGSEYGLLYSANTEEIGRHLKLLRISPEGVPDGTFVSTPPNHSLDSRWDELGLAWSGSEFAIFWKEYSEDSQQIMFNRVGYCE